VTRQVQAVAGSLAALAAATGLVYALRPIAPTLSLGVVYTLAVLAAAVLFGAGPAIAVAVLSMLAFNFFFLAPVGTLTLADARNWTALVVYLVTALVASELAAQARRRAVEAEQREREAALLADAAAALLREAPIDELAERRDAILRDADDVARRRYEAAVDSLLTLAAERREAEALRRSDALKTIVLQTVSHDFRTPIATISAAVGGLQDEQLALGPEDRRELLDTIGLETARLARLVANVLDLSRLQAGAAAPRPALWSVDDLVGQAVADVSDPGRVGVEVPGDLAPLEVDAGQVQRVLVNLIENALKFSAAPVLVSASRDGDGVALDVLDRGPGPDESPASARGLGLGLEIARGFAGLNGGRVELSRRADGGTRARLAFAPTPARSAT
jgi:two-component system, OmpR family, sensor histidine kinase KdpD